MKKTSNRNNSPLEIQLSDKNRKRRILLICICVAVAIVAFTVGLFHLLNAEDGWQTVEAISDETNCSADFTFHYNFSGLNATADKKNLTVVYSDAAEKAYQLFTPNKEFSGNVWYVNHHANETVTVDPVLYDAFSKLDQADTRVLYLGPAYAHYDHIFFAEGDEWAEAYDPSLNPEAADYLAQLSAFVNDENAIDLKLLGNNQVKLEVSQEYLDFLQENGVENLIDFNWMTNAFIVDFLADTVAKAGFDDGVLVSYDGYSRHLDTSGTQFSFPVMDYHDRILYPATTMQYNEPTAIVSLRAYPIADTEYLFSYIWDDWRITTSHIDPEDCLNKTSIENMVSYSRNATCVDILLKIMPTFIAEEFDSAPLKALVADDIYSIWTINLRVYYNDPSLDLSYLYSDDTIAYKTALVS